MRFCPRALSPSLSWFIPQVSKTQRSNLGLKEIYHEKLKFVFLILGNKTLIRVQHVCVYESIIRRRQLTVLDRRYSRQRCTNRLSR
ncbi:hypothetical protein L6452_40714 [Arctium lappa]|uniref:Uncharacterized protein n=1 Tax=Arctium lappa TaxID=4217 RepID=A0ACB8XN25_ARCLA|nr:hypothetical protein L6452_40714 [Arctium lappa]